MLRSRRAADRCRAAGNAAFGGGQWAQALGHYEQGCGHEKSNFKLHANAAAAALKLGCSVRAVEHCDKVLSIIDFLHENKPSLDGHRVKALFRRARARLALGHAPQALTDLEQAAGLDGGDCEVARLFATARRIVEEESRAKNLRESAQAASGSKEEVHRVRLVERFSKALWELLSGPGGGASLEEEEGGGGGGAPAAGTGGGARRRAGRGRRGRRRPPCPGRRPRGGRPSFWRSSRSCWPRARTAGCTRATAGPWRRWAPPPRGWAPPRDGARAPCWAACARRASPTASRKRSRAGGRCWRGAGDSWQGRTGQPLGPPRSCSRLAAPRRGRARRSLLTFPKIQRPWWGAGLLDLPGAGDAGDGGASGAALALLSNLLTQARMKQALAAGELDYRQLVRRAAGVLLPPGRTSAAAGATAGARETAAGLLGNACGSADVRAHVAALPGFVAGVVGLLPAGGAGPRADKVRPKAPTGEAQVSAFSVLALLANVMLEGPGRAAFCAAGGPAALLQGVLADPLFPTPVSARAALGLARWAKDPGAAAEAAADGGVGKGGLLGRVLARLHVLLPAAGGAASDFPRGGPADVEAAEQGLRFVALCARAGGGAGAAAALRLGAPEVLLRARPLRRCPAVRPGTQPWRWGTSPARPTASARWPLTRSSPSSTSPIAGRGPPPSASRPLPSPSSPAPRTAWAASASSVPSRSLPLTSRTDAM